MYKHVVLGVALLTGVGAHHVLSAPTTTRVVESPKATIAPGRGMTLIAECQNRDGISGGGKSDEGQITGTMPEYDGNGSVVGWTVTVLNPTDHPIGAVAVVVCQS